MRFELHSFEQFQPRQQAAGHLVVFSFSGVAPPAAERPRQRWLQVPVGVVVAGGDTGGDAVAPTYGDAGGVALARHAVTLREN